MRESRAILATARGYDKLLDNLHHVQTTQNYPRIISSIENVICFEFLRFWQNAIADSADVNFSV